MSDFISSTMSVVTMLKDSGSSIIDDVGSGLTEALNVVGVNLDTTLLATINNLKAGIETALDSIKEGANGVWDRLEVQRDLILQIINNFIAIVEKLIGSVVSAGESLVNGATLLVETIESKLQNVYVVVKNITDLIKTNITDTLPAAQRAIDLIFNSIRNMGNELGSSISSVFKQVTDEAHEIIQSFTLYIHDAYQAIQDMYNDITNQLEMFLLDFEDSVNSVIKELNDAIDTSVRKIENAGHTLKTITSEAVVNINRVNAALDMSNIIKVAATIVVTSTVCIIAAVSIIRYTKRLK